ncbi:MAG: M20/M25/M40 family metallo-hydrolase [Candidatus Caldarchaeum sp.]|nr:M20/M25/M40 family metallo-hydrolase [Candidatus Caldarchaeum sp.]MCS7134152.1 M20/M25/M40 family metallo-hydrolase [Candidatus Caldarchaeum sp.]MCX8201204.1 M20/M25/M40 family metallo-hydrolase [Candidatus Caldarchaeum sp.]MDW8063569.1 M20/M25/M40 family metallo-hydrolase [Candidatus Caldarchaeum sp.]MDW8435356.1 M20/M25/M40 family metallo-hydrolase [Candidatus Caldarchaeum sp.]
MSSVEIYKEAVVSTLVQLMEVYTPPGEERRLERTWYRVCGDLGYRDVWRDEVGNYFAAVGRGGRTVMLVSHVDTVPGELRVKVSEGRISGRGAVDAKGPLSAMLLAGGYLSDKLKNVRLIVAGLVDEEGMGSGAKKLVEEGVKADSIIIGEPTGTVGIAVSYRGSVSVKVHARAQGGHASAPYIAESALTKILKLWNLVEHEFGGERYEEITSALTTLHAGDWISRIPEKAEGTLNIRFPHPYTSKEIISKLEQFVKASDCEMEVIDITEPVVTSVGNAAARGLQRAMLRLGLKPKIVKKTGTSDMNTLVAVTPNIVACGPGDSTLAHTAMEAVEIKDIITAAKIYTEFAREIDSA